MGTTRLDASPTVLPMLLRAAATARGRGGPLPEDTFALDEVRVDREEVAAYDLVCGFRLRDEVPSTFVHTLTFPLQVALMSRRDFPLPMPGIVHVRNRITQRRPVRADEVLAASVRAERLRPHPKGTQVDLVGAARVGEELVWEGRSTYLSRGSRAGQGSATDDAPLVVDVPDAPPAAVWRVAEDTGRRYAAVTGDVNPIHLHALSAKAMGFPRAIVHGMWTVGRVLAALEPRVPPAYTLDVAFKRPVLLPSTVALHLARTEDAGWDVAVRRRRGDGEHLLAALRPL